MFKVILILEHLDGDLKAYADTSNMYLTMEKTTDNVTLYTLSICI
jgi:hypothetical protein